MAKVIVVYESKYGNTKRVAETIIEGMRGPILEEELPKCNEFGNKRATQIKKLETAKV